MDASKSGFAYSLLFEPIDPPGVGLPRSERADIKAIPRQRMQQRGIVDLGIVGERDESGVTVDAERRQRLVGPFSDDFHVRESFRRGECHARIDDGHVVAEKLCDRRQCLADVHGAGNDELRRRHIHGEENASLRGLLHAASSAAQALGKQCFQRILADIAGLHQPLLAGGDISDNDRCAARGPLGIQGGEKIELHSRSQPSLPKPGAAWRPEPGTIILSNGARC